MEHQNGRVPTASSPSPRESSPHAVSPAAAASVSSRGRRDEVAKLKARLAEARETNRRLQRRLQAAESGALRDEAVRDLWRAKRDAGFSQQWALQSYDRMGQSFDTVKDIYKLAAEVLGLPRERFHSVMDSAFTDPVYKFKGGHPEPGIIYANVFLTPVGGVMSYDIRGVVEAAIKHLRGQRVSVSDERAKREDAERPSPQGASATPQG